MGDTPGKKTRIRTLERRKCIAVRENGAGKTMGIENRCVSELT